MLLDEVVVVSITAGDYYIGGGTSGSTVNVTLQRGDEIASCDGILIWEEEYCDSDLFDEWVACALAGEEGYTYTEGAE